MRIVGESLLTRVLVHFFVIFGLWSKFQPNTISSAIYHTISYTMHFTLSLCYTVFMLVGLMFRSDVDEITSSICVTFTCVAYCAKILNFYWHNADMKNCFHQVNEFVLENEHEEELLRIRLVPFKKLSLFYYIVPNICGITAYLKPIFATETELPFLGWYPLDWAHKSLDYWMTYVYQVVGIFIEINLNVTLELFPSYLMYMLSIQMEILGLRLEGMSSATCGNDVLVNDISLRNKGQQEVFGKMVNYLKMHQKMDE